MDVEITKESLETKLETIQNELNELKEKINNFSEDEKKEIEKAEDMVESKHIKEELETTGQELEQLKNSGASDLGDIESELQRINTEYEQAIRAFNEELTSLKEDVGGGEDSDIEDSQDNTGGEEKKTVKERFKEKKEWVKEQRNGLTSKEEWKEHTGKNILRALGGVGIVGGVAWLGKTIFGKKNWESRIPGYENMTRKEKRKARRKWRKEQKSQSFRERPFGKTLKWIGIGTGIYYIVHGFATGHWHPKELFIWDKDEKIKTPDEQVSDYEALTQEQREVYEKIGDNINNFYGKIRNQDKKLGFIDNNYLGTISENVKAKNGEKIETYKGLVPFCIDTSTESIERILSEHEIESLCFNSDKEKLWLAVKDWGKEKLEKVLGKFIPFLDSFKGIGGDTLGDKLSNWLNPSTDQTKQRQNELEYFFRQYMKVLVYVNDKKTELEYKLTENEIKFNGFKEEDDDTPQTLQSNNPEKNYNLIIEAMNNQDWFDKHIKNNEKYKKFMSSRLFDINKELKHYELDNGNTSEYLEKKVLNKLDREERTILNIRDKDIEEAGENGTIHTMLDDGISELDPGNTDSGGKLENSTKGDLLDMCEDLIDDINDEFSEGILHKYLEHISIRCNTENANMEEFLKETGLIGAVEGYKSIITDLKTKINDGTVTKENLIQLKQSTAKRFAFKKEVEVAIYSMKDIKGDNPDLLARFVKGSWALIENIFKSLKNIFTGNGTKDDYLVALGGIGTIIIITHPGKTVEIVRKVGTKTIGKTIQGTGRLIGKGITSPHMSTRGLGKKLKNIPNLVDKKSYFLSYLTEGGSWNEKKLLKIAREELGIDKPTIGEMLEELFGSGINGVKGDDLWRCCQDKNLAKLAIECESTNNVSWYKKVGKRRQKRIYKVNKQNTGWIISSLDELENCGGAESKKILTELLHSVNQADNLEFCHDLIYGVSRGDVSEIKIKSLGKINRSYLDGLDDAAKSKPNAIYEHIAIKKFARGNSDKETMLKVIFEEQENLTRTSTNMADAMIKEFEGVKHTIRNINNDEFDVIKKLCKNGTSFDTNALRALFGNNTVFENILREFNQLDNSQKTWRKLGDIILREGNQISELKTFAQKLVRAGSDIGDAKCFIRTMNRMKKIVNVVRRF